MIQKIQEIEATPFSSSSSSRLGLVFQNARVFRASEDRATDTSGVLALFHSDGIGKNAFLRRPVVCGQDNSWVLEG